MRLTSAICSPHHQPFNLPEPHTFRVSGFLSWTRCASLSHTAEAQGISVDEIVGAMRP